MKICHQYNQGDAVYSSSYGLIYTGTSDNIQEEPIKSNDNQSNNKIINSTKFETSYELYVD